MGDLRSGRRHVVVVVAAVAVIGSATVGIACGDDAAELEPGAPDAGTNATADAGGGDGASPSDDGGGGCAADVGGDGLPSHLVCTELYADVAAKTLGPGVRAYTPAVQFWSDDAAKSRWIHLPAGTTIDATNPDDWKFPVGTKLWKEMSVAGKRVETRLYAKLAEGSWKKTTYRWNDAETDAVRLDRGETVPRTGLPSYEVPPSNACTSCHKGKSEPVIGFDAVSLGLPGAAGLTLEVLAAEKLAVPAPAVTAYAIPDDGTGKAAPAISWLHANCGSCHQASPTAEGVNSKTYFRLLTTQLGPGGVTTASELDAVATTCGKASGKGTPDGGLPLKRLAPGSPEESSIYVLAASRTGPQGFPGPNEQMPPLVSHQVDLAGITLLREWITALPACP